MPRFRDNPDFPGTRADVEADWARMAREPRPLQRPVVVLAGWRAPASARGVGARLRSVTSGRAEDFLSIAYPGAGDIGAAASIAAARIRERFGGARSVGPAEVDVVGISMGGLVARVLAAGLAGSEPIPVRIRRLFTLATPHRGAKLAALIAPDRASRDMRTGSAVLADLDRRLAGADLELVCYAQLRDWWVGASRTAPPGHAPVWVDTEGVPQHAFSHFLINFNRRVLRDIARRLRGEEPVSRRGSAPPSD